MDATLCITTASNAVAAFLFIYLINLESSLQDQGGLNLYSQNALAGSQAVSSISFHL